MGEHVEEEEVLLVRRGRHYVCYKSRVSEEKVSLWGFLRLNLDLPPLTRIIGESDRVDWIMSDHCTYIYISLAETSVTIVLGKDRSFEIRGASCFQEAFKHAEDLCLIILAAQPQSFLLPPSSSSSFDDDDDDRHF